MADILYTPRSSNDREDFIEDKIQLAELIKIGAAFDVLKDGQDTTGKIIVGHGIGHRTFNGDPLWPDLRQKKLVDNYHNTETFKNFSLRKFEIAPFTDEGIAAAAKRLGGTVLVKYAGAQKITPIFLIDTAHDIGPQIMDNCGWEMVRVGGEDRRVIVQQQIPMRYEYRIFVVDGFPVTGAGCIEEMTPLENEERFDPKMQKIRSKTEVISDPLLANRYRQYADNLICPSFDKEGIRDYTLDLFINDEREVGVVEINPAYKAGFYANDYSALFSKIIKKCTDDY